ncbi:MAG: tetratricopeptide repeat protein [Thermodesulfobacteriota bacterium]
MLAELKDGNGIRAALAVKRATAVSQILQQAQGALTQSDYAAAWTALRQALAQDQRSPAPALAAATLLARLCDAEGVRAMQAEAQRRGAAGAAPQPPAEPDQRACQAQALNKDGVALARQGSPAEALAKFDQALKTTPAPLPKANYNAALVLERQGQAQAAARQYLAAHQAFLLASEQNEALTRLLALAQQAKLGVPEAADQRYRLGVVRAKQKRHAEAVAEFEAALQEAPWLVDAYYNLGLVYDFVNRPADALRVLRIYVQLAPNSPNLGPVKTKIVELEDKLGLIAPR